jgi:methylthioribose-1-phosphate isomerase
MFDFESKS